jgi:hypothetical protein
MDSGPKKDAPKAAKKGINWLSIIGIVVLVVVIAAVIYLMMIWNQTKDNRLIQGFMNIEPKLQEMQEKYTQAQIDEMAQHVEAVKLAEDPTGYDDAYVVIDGTVSAEETDVVDLNIARNVFSDTKLKAYVLDQAIVMVDITGTGATYPEGTVLRGYGVVLNVKLDDIWKLPIVGPNLKKEFDGVQGMSDQVTFFFSKGVKVIQPAGPGTKKPAEAKPADDKGAAAAEGDKPAVAGEKPAAEGETAPPKEGEGAPPKEGDGGGAGKPGEGAPPAPPAGK